MKWNFERAMIRRDYLQNQFDPATNSILVCVKLDNRLDPEATAVDRPRPQRQRIIFRSDGIDDTTIARSPLYSVSHFIDCGRAARRLGPSRSASTQNAISKPR
jgi:hypothetical protein